MGHIERNTQTRIRKFSLCFRVRLDDGSEIYSHADTDYNADVSEIPKLIVKEKLLPNIPRNYVQYRTFGETCGPVKTEAVFPKRRQTSSSLHGITSHSNTA